MDAKIVTDAIATVVMIGKFDANPTVDELAIGNRWRVYARRGRYAEAQLLACSD